MNNERNWETHDCIKQGLSGVLIEGIPCCRPMWLLKVGVLWEKSDESKLMSHGYFDELVVVPKLSLTNNTYKSLPTPVFYDANK